MFRVVCSLIAFQAASFGVLAGFGLLVSDSQRTEIDRVLSSGGPSVLSISIVAGALGLLTAGLLVAVKQRRRLGLRLTVTWEFVMLLCGALYLPIAIATGIDIVNAWIIAVSPVSAGVILYGLLVSDGVRRHFALHGGG